MLTIYIDADACPVKDEVYRVARRYEMRVAVVANAPLRVPAAPGRNPPKKKAKNKSVGRAHPGPQRMRPPASAARQNGGRSGRALVNRWATATSPDRPAASHPAPAAASAAPAVGGAWPRP